MTDATKPAGEEVDGLCASCSTVSATPPNNVGNGGDTYPEVPTSIHEQLWPQSGRLLEDEMAMEKRWEYAKEEYQREKGDQDQ